MKHLGARVPGERVWVFRHYDEGEHNAVDIFESENNQGIVASTIGVMEYDQGGAAGSPLQTEILVDARGRPCDVANVAATAAFFVMKDGWRIRPGVTFTDVVTM